MDDCIRCNNKLLLTWWWCVGVNAFCVFCQNGAQASITHVIKSSSGHLWVLAIFKWKPVEGVEHSHGIVGCVRDCCELHRDVSCAAVSGC